MSLQSCKVTVWKGKKKAWLGWSMHSGRQNPVIITFSFRFVFFFFLQSVPDFLLLRLFLFSFSSYSYPLILLPYTFTPTSFFLSFLSFAQVALTILNLTLTTNAHNCIYLDTTLHSIPPSSFPLQPSSSIQEPSETQWMSASGIYHFGIQPIPRKSRTPFQRRSESRLHVPSYQRRGLAIFTSSYLSFSLFTQCSLS
ncbi:hypothetical protein K457DRAFT_1177636 [Linnemannia elongata AG-77]|uniref:Uncharacterized protein n=1 Tax=Linnemannia elongata AG-77 TaxID=1314771 RepID=A0A197K4Z9_9FUNG|nr:hypothetical protein K457DRAFT_1177636 [Linnemannia elongata AG-77]